MMRSIVHLLQAPEVSHEKQKTPPGCSAPPAATLLDILK
jgi:hypothetical protein